MATTTNVAETMGATKVSESWATHLLNAYKRTECFHLVFNLICPTTVMKTIKNTKKKKTVRFHLPQPSPEASEALPGQQHEWEVETGPGVQEVVLAGNLLVVSVYDEAKGEGEGEVVVYEMKMDRRHGEVVARIAVGCAKAYHLNAREVDVEGAAGLAVVFVTREWEEGVYADSG